MNKRKKSQVWYIDFMVGLLIFIVVIITYYQYANNFVDESEDEWQEMIVDSKSITSSLISAGHPANWTAETAEIIGLTDGNYRINSTKLARFENISYKDAKSMLNTRFDFYFFIEGENKTVIYETGLNATDARFLVHTTRFAIYNSSIVRMVFYLWRA